MAVQNPYLSTDGDLEQAKRKRAGESLAIDAVPKQTNFDVTNTPAAQPQPAVQGDPARAARMQAQFNQPVTIGNPATERPAPAPDSAGLNRMISGALSIAPAAIWEGAKNLGTDAANVGRSIIDAEQVPRPGYPRTAQLSREVAEGANVFAGANRNLEEGAKSVARDATGSAPIANPTSPMLQRDAVDPPATPATAPASSSQTATAPSQDVKQPGQPAPAKKADSPYFATDSGIAARRNENGTPEFSNDPTVLANAQAMPVGGIGGQALRTPGVSNMADDVALEKRGSINNIGNGIGGGLSVGAPGDAALALGRFERANQEREKMIQASRRGGIGEGGGRVTIVKDSSRTPTLQERQLLRLDSLDAQNEAVRSQSQQSIMSGADELMTSQLNRQKTQQEIEVGQAGLESQQRLAKLGAMMADPNLGADQRQAARDAYTSLSISPTDRFKAEQDGNAQRQKLIGELYKSYSKDAPFGPDGKTPIPFDQWVQPVLQQVGGGIGAESAPAKNSAPAVGTRQGGYEFLGGNPSDKKNWRKV